MKTRVKEKAERAILGHYSVSEIRDGLAQKDRYEVSEAYLQLHDAAFEAFGALVGSHAADDSVQGKARARLRAALGIA